MPETPRQLTVLGLAAKFAVQDIAKVRRIANQSEPLRSSDSAKSDYPSLLTIACPSKNMDRSSVRQGYQNIGYCIRWHGDSKRRSETIDRRLRKLRSRLLLLLAPVYSPSLGGHIAACNLNSYRRISPRILID
jgi:hypothetical protein